MCFFELLNELVVVDIVGGKAVLCGHETQCRGEVGPAHARRAEEGHVFSVFSRALKRLCKRE